MTRHPRLNLTLAALAGMGVIGAGMAGVAYADYPPTGSPSQAVAPEESVRSQVEGELYRRSWLINLAQPAAGKRANVCQRRPGSLRMWSCFIRYRGHAGPRRQAVARLGKNGLLASLGARNQPVLKRGKRATYVDAVAEQVEGRLMRRASRGGPIPLTRPVCVRTGRIANGKARLRCRALIGGKRRTMAVVAWHGSAKVIRVVVR